MNVFQRVDKVLDTLCPAGGGRGDNWSRDYYLPYFEAIRSRLGAIRCRDCEFVWVNEGSMQEERDRILRPVSTVFPT